MSCSKSPVTNREPKCARCRHHGYVVPQKGHVKSCPFLSCTCWKCALVTERSRIGALQRKIRNSETEASGSGGTSDPQTPMGVAESSGTYSVSRRSSSSLQSEGPGTRFLQKQEVEDEEGKNYAQLATVRPPEMVVQLLQVPEEERFSRPSTSSILQRGSIPNPPPQVASPDSVSDRDHLEARSPVIRTQQQDRPVDRSHLQVSYVHEVMQREFAFSPVAMPMIVWGRCPNGCAPCPGILLNMPPSPCPHGPFYTYTPASHDGSGLFSSTQPSSAYPAPYHRSDHF